MVKRSTRDASAWLGLVAGSYVAARVAAKTRARSVIGPAIYGGVALGLFALERRAPFRESWNTADRHEGEDVGLTVAGPLIAGELARVGVGFGAALIASRIKPRRPWPTAAPFVVQVALATLTADLVHYWLHRWSHERGGPWRFHEVHHNPDRLGVRNASRTHPIEAARNQSLKLGVLVLAGAPAPVLGAHAAITGTIALLSHCNVRLDTGVLDEWFNTPTAHRWHHAVEAAERNVNYGENTLLWDRLFKTRYRGSVEGPTAVGVERPPVRRGFVAQLAAPFRRAA